VDEPCPGCLEKQPGLFANLRVTLHSSYMKKLAAIQTNAGGGILTFTTPINASTQQFFQILIQ
jgi:hypothetical protein